LEVQFIMLKMDKKAQSLAFEAIMGIIALILTFFLAYVWLVDVSTTECKNNEQCEQKEYCGVDKFCHTIPTVVQEVKITETITTRHYGWAGFILGLNLVISAIILRRRR